MIARDWGQGNKLLFIEYRASVCKDEKVLDGGDTTTARQRGERTQCHWTGHSSVADAAYFLTMTPTTEWACGSSREAACLEKRSGQAAPQLEAGAGNLGQMLPVVVSAINQRTERADTGVERMSKLASAFATTSCRRQQRQAGHVHAWQVLRRVYR